MNADAWRRAEEIFHAALELDAADRIAFVANSCGENAALLEDVTSLLHHHDRASDFIESPAMLDPSDADVPSDDAADPLIGQQLGHYRIEARIGHGGMGVVYLASDSRLGRAVAIKALAPHLTAGEERRKRLWREARAAAALSHPGIATIYAIEEFDGSVYLVSEYIRGRTLREELADGPLAPARVIGTAIAIGHALVAAHEHGVVHRDLKPDNIIRTDDGRVKILDFGLALLPDSIDVRDARLTQSGAILGRRRIWRPSSCAARPSTPARINSRSAW